MYNFLKTDVTLVKVYNKFLLVGLGSNFLVYHKETKQLINETKLLQCQTIHGLKINENIELILYGGKQFIVVQILEGAILRKSNLSFCDDWILDVAWLGDNAYALLTAHNVVQIWCFNILQNKYYSESNSILYSGKVYPLQNNVLLVMAGMVYSQIHIELATEGTTLHQLIGHKGVIFSIEWSDKKNIIVTTSDDRSVKLWSVTSEDGIASNTLEYWQKSQIACIHTLFGHLARVHRSHISNECIISVGEDSLICYWDFDGNLIRKIKSHQRGCIWSVHSDETHSITGGGDCAVTLHPLKALMNDSHIHNFTIAKEYGKPKKIQFTAQNNILILCDTGVLIFDCNGSKSIYKLEHKTTYKMLSLSSCKQLIATCDMSGCLDIFVETCKSISALVCLMNIQLDVGNILSMHWAGNRHILICNDKGFILVLGTTRISYDLISRFVLPPSKERYLTACAINDDGNLFICGDRSGNIYFYLKGGTNPVKVFKKAHGVYGPNSIYSSGFNVKTMGRDGTIKYFKMIFKENKFVDIKLMYSIDFPFTWIEKFLNKNETLVCGFREKAFVVYDLEENRECYEISCGGGHRPYDAIRYFESNKSIIDIMYYKNSNINRIKVDLNEIKSSNIIVNFHTKEINSVVLYESSFGTMMFSGGEDTLFRISKVTNRELKNFFSLKHLSSIRDICLVEYSNSNSGKIIVFSTGGRAQINVWLITITNNLIETEHTLDYMIKGTDKQRRGNNSWCDTAIEFDPETRIMCLNTIKKEQSILLIAGCSDALMRVYKFNIENLYEIKLLATMNFHKTCILKMFTISNNENFITMSMTSTGHVAFWDLTNYLSDDLQDVRKPVFEIRTNKAGINCGTAIMVDDLILLATGGDDNAIVLTLVSDCGTVITNYTCDNWHSSQITGLMLYNNYLISTSIDQRVTISKWKLNDNNLLCEFLEQTWTDVADVKGLCLADITSEGLQIYVYGKGIELINIKLENPFKMAPVVETITEPAKLGEGPHWDVAQQCLYFVDIFGGTINKYVPANKKHTKANVDGQPGFIIPVEGTNDEFVVGVNHKIFILKWDGESVTTKIIKILSEVDTGTNNRLNDGKVDPKGRLYAGTMGAEKPPGTFEMNKGSLFRFDAGKEPKKLADKISISNGLAWDLKEEAFYYIDTFDFDVRRYDYDIDTGEISNKKMIFNFRENNVLGNPDGMTIDTEGNLWIACFGGNRVIRIDPRSGKLLETIELPASQITSVAFGGPNMDELYVTSAAIHIDSEQLPPAGATFKITGLNATGLPAGEFKLKI